MRIRDNDMFEHVLAEDLAEDDVVIYQGELRKVVQVGQDEMTVRIVFEKAEGSRKINETVVHADDDFAVLTDERIRRPDATSRPMYLVPRGPEN